MRRKLLVLELWGLGDIALATPFLRAASTEFDTTLLAKPFARDLQKHCWPSVRVRTFAAPWTSFRGKYRLLTWPWKEMRSLLRELKAEEFEVGVSARRDPRDHILLRCSGAMRRLGFPRVGSQVFLTQPLNSSSPLCHRYECWWILGQVLGLDLPSIESFPFAHESGSRTILVHSGAAQPVRVWPLDRYQTIVRRLRELGHSVRVVADPDQHHWWQSHGEKDFSTPTNVDELVVLFEQAKLFIGNDSGPGHLAAILGLPTFTVFGPQLPESFRPIHKEAAWIEGKPCPYKPCFDDCHFSEPFCLLGVSEEEVWLKVEQFVRKNVSACPT